MACERLVADPCSRARESISNQSNLQQALKSFSCSTQVYQMELSVTTRWQRTSISSEEWVSSASEQVPRLVFLYFFGRCSRHARHVDLRYCSQRYAYFDLHCSHLIYIIASGCPLLLFTYGREWIRMPPLIGSVGNSINVFWSLELCYVFIFWNLFFIQFFYNA